MAAATPTDDFGLVAPSQYHYNDKTSKELPLLENVMPGDVLKLTANGYRKAQAGERGNGIGIKKGRAGQAGYDFALVGEADGYEPNLVPGTPLYPSGATNGGLDTTAVASFAPQVLCIGKSRIRYNFLV